MNSRRIALCGLLTALAVVLMVLSGAIGIGTYAGPVLAMAALLPILIEYGPRFAGAAYGAAALSSLLLVPDVETALVYAVFGWYPILRPRITALPSKSLRLVCRLAVCNGAIFLLYGLLARLLGLPPVTEEAGGKVLALVLLAAGNAVFLLMDRALANLTRLWQNRLRKKLWK